MSEFIFKLPDLGEGMVESEIGEWFISVGDQVSEEDVVGTMMTDKAAIEVSSPITGKVIRLGGEPGDVVAVGAALLVFETDGVDVGAPSPVGGPSRPEGSRLEAAPTTPAPTVAPTGPNGQKRVMTSPAIRRRAREAGIDLSAVPGSGSGGRVLRKDFDAFVGVATVVGAGSVATSVSNTISAAPTATMSPGSPASLMTVPVIGEDNSTAALSVIIVPTTSSSDT